MTSKLDPTFWNRAFIPVNTENKDYELVNPVVVAERFVEVTHDMAQLAQHAEEGSDAIASLELDLSVNMRKTSKIRKRLLADNYDDVTKTASSEIQEAFILKCARDAGEEVLSTLENLEIERQDLESKISDHKLALEKIKNRMKLIQINMELAKQYLDHEKLLTRVSMNSRV